MKIQIDEQPPDAMQKYYNTPTPETDAAKRRITGMADEWVPRYVSEQLERQRDEALADLTFRRELYELQTAQLDDMQKDRDEWKAKYIQQNKDLGCELMDPNGTIWEHAQTLQRKLDEAREAEASEAKWAALYKAERDEAREAVVAGVAKWAELYKAERDRARESRDEWQNEIIGWKNKWDCAAKIAVRAECKRDEMALRWEQANDALFSERALADRLADAVESFLSQPVAPLAPMRESLAAWKEARK